MAPLAPRDLFQTAVLSQIPSSLENKDKFKQQQRQGQRTKRKVNANKKANTNTREDKNTMKWKDDIQHYHWLAQKCLLSQTCFI